MCMSVFNTLPTSKKRPIVVFALWEGLETLLFSLPPTLKTPPKAQKKTQKLNATKNNSFYRVMSIMVAEIWRFFKDYFLPPQLLCYVA